MFATSSAGHLHFGYAEKLNRYKHFPKLLILVCSFPYLGGPASLLHLQVTCQKATEERTIRAIVFHSKSKYANSYSIFLK